MRPHRWPGCWLGVGAAIVASMAAGCSPEIVSGAYYCGPERLCPSNLVCDDNSYTCVLPAEREPFSCPAGSEVHEPDDAQTDAWDAGELSCGTPLLAEFTGCVREGDVDWLKYSDATTCNGEDPRILISLSFPVALVPLTLELVDPAGEVIAIGRDCTPEENLTGQSALCIELQPTRGEFYLRVGVREGGPNCDGSCQHNQYTLDVLFPLA